jgi:hypothetical protein
MFLPAVVPSAFHFPAYAGAFNGCQESSSDTRTFRTKHHAGGISTAIGNAARRNNGNFHRVNNLGYQGKSSNFVR